MLPILGNDPVGLATARYCRAVTFAGSESQARKTSFTTPGLEARPCTVPLCWIDAAALSNGCIDGNGCCVPTEYRHKARDAVLNESATLVLPGASRLLPGLMLLMPLWAFRDRTATVKSRAKTPHTRAVRCRMECQSNTKNAGRSQSTADQSSSSSLYFLAALTNGPGMRTLSSPG